VLEGAHRPARAAWQAFAAAHSAASLALPFRASAYYAQEDALLLVHYGGPEELSAAYSVPAQPSFCAWEAAGAPALPPEAYALALALAAVRSTTRFAYFPDGGVLEGAGGAEGTSLKLGGSVWGFRGLAGSALVATFPDGSALHAASPGAAGEPATLQYTSAGGVTVQLSASGQLLLRAAQRLKPAMAAVIVGAAAAALAPAEELFRAVSADGQVAVYLSSGEVRVLAPDGAVAERPAGANGWVHTAPDGARAQQRDPQLLLPPEPEAPSEGGEGGEGAPAAAEAAPPPAADAVDGEAGGDSAAGDADAAPAAPPPLQRFPPEPLEAAPVAEVVDPDTGARVVTRSDLGFSVLYPSGKALIVHADGSRLHREPCEGLLWARARPLDCDLCGMCMPRRMVTPHCTGTLQRHRIPMRQGHLQRSALVRRVHRRRGPHQHCAGRSPPEARRASAGAGAGRPADGAGHPGRHVAGASWRHHAGLVLCGRRRVVRVSRRRVRCALRRRRAGRGAQPEQPQRGVRRAGRRGGAQRPHGRLLPVPPALSGGALRGRRRQRRGGGCRRAAARRRPRARPAAPP